MLPLFFYLFYIIQAYIEYLKIYDSSSAGLVFLIASARQRASSGVPGDFLAQKATALHFGVYLWHPWMDFGNFFNFTNPICIFFMFYFANICARSLWKELQRF